VLKVLSDILLASRNRRWWSVCPGAIRFICSLRQGRPPHPSAAPDRSTLMA